MEPLTDTDPEARRVQMELLRRASPDRRLRLALSLSRRVLTLSREAIACRRPRASEERRSASSSCGLGVADLLARALAEAEGK